MKLPENMTFDEFRSALLRELRYDPDTGEMWWTVPKARRRLDRPCGCPDTLGYLGIRIFGRLYAVHVLAWVMHYNEMPPKIIDHDNGQVADNWIKNLRPATPKQNSANRRMKKVPASGWRGVRQQTKSGNWQASVSDGNRPVNAGTYRHAFDAAVAYDLKAKEIHGDYAVLNFPGVPDVLLHELKVPPLPGRDYWAAAKRLGPVVHEFAKLYHEMNEWAQEHLRPESPRKRETRPHPVPEAA